MGEENGENSASDERRGMSDYCKDGLLILVCISMGCRARNIHKKMYCRKPGVGSTISDYIYLQID